MLSSTLLTPLTQCIRGPQYQVFLSLESAQLPQGQNSAVSGASPSPVCQVTPLSCPSQFCPQAPDLLPRCSGPFAYLPEKSVYSNVHIDSFPPRKKFTLEISFLQLSLIAHHILSPGSALSLVRTKHVPCGWNCPLWALPEGQSFLTC